jgi:hypothetical protein
MTDKKTEERCAPGRRENDRLEDNVNVEGERTGVPSEAALGALAAGEPTDGSMTEKDPEENDVTHEDGTIVRERETGSVRKVKGADK